MHTTHVLAGRVDRPREPSLIVCRGFRMRTTSKAGFEIAAFYERTWISARDRYTRHGPRGYEAQEGTLAMRCLYLSPFATGHAKLFLNTYQSAIAQRKQETYGTGRQGHRRTHYLPFCHEERMAIVVLYRPQIHNSDWRLRASLLGLAQALHGLERDQTSCYRDFP